MAGGGGGDLSGNAAKPLGNELLQAPSGAVAGEHGEVVYVEIAALVGLGNLRIVNLAEPVVGGDGAGVGENQSAHGGGDGGVLLDPPVVDVEVVVYQLFVIQHGGAKIADLLPLLAVENVRFGHVAVTCLDENVFNAVLNLLHGDRAIFNLVLIVGGDLQRQQIDDVGVIGLRHSVERFGNGHADFGQVEIHDFAVPLQNSIHTAPTLSQYTDLPFLRRTGEGASPAAALHTDIQNRTEECRSTFRPYFNGVTNQCQLEESLYLVEDFMKNVN
ncbi:hypothetical protein SDC9_110335 [bioreactor metagenome]|uniref:Uncharacterized protein n=1 Tax=bioreactor metagenome TaxID=1076179 RepID=A0A645BDC7_9ZZZZ